MAHTSNSLNLSVEQTPAKIRRNMVPDIVRAHADEITIPHVADEQIQYTVRAAEHLINHHGVEPSRVRVHIGARNITSRLQLTSALRNLNALNVQNVLLVGGNPTEPKGPFGTSEYLYPKVRKHMTVDRIFCGIYPDWENPQSVLRNKLNRYDGGITQLCLSTPRLMEYVAVPTVRIGLPSMASYEGLWYSMKRCGVRPSLRFPLRNVGGMVRYMRPKGFDTVKMLHDLQPHRHFHLYDFGRIGQTVEAILDNT